MALYDEIGFVNIPWLLSLDVDFIYMVGGRSTGKTYGTLKTTYLEHIKMMYLRRTQTQCDLINKPDFSPYKSLNRKEGYNIGIEPIGKFNGGIYNMKDNGEKFVPDGAPIGYTGALSTIANMRGFDASDIEVLAYDEFIAEKHERPLRNEGAALFNAYETINRNRDLPPPIGEGRKALKLICMANANDLANPIFLYKNLVRIADKMRKEGTELYINKKERYALIIFKDSPISAAKAEQALYKHTKGSDFSSMSIGNDFSGEERGTIKSMPIKEYRPVVTVGEITIYKHKSNGTVYVTCHRSGTPETFTCGENDLTRFSRSYSWVWEYYMSKKIIFEEYLCEILLNKYFS